MSIGDYIVLGLSALLAFLSLLDEVDTAGFKGSAYSFGFFVGGFLFCAIVGYICLFTFRYVREHHFAQTLPSQIPEQPKPPV
jgi:Na+/melibiose symporter-like transporter